MQPTLSVRALLRKMLTGVTFLFMVTNAVAQGKYVTNGSAAANGDNCFRLTPDLEGQGGSVWYQNYLSLQQNFDFTFTVNLGSNAGGADGIAFVLQSKGVTQGATGNNLGYGGISPSLAIEFDTYENFDTNSDPVFDHIAIQKNGNTSHAPGGGTVAGPVQASPAKSNIKDGLDHTTRITWNVDTRTLQVYFDASLRLTYQGDIVKDIFGGNPNLYWGFTGSTGLLHNLQSFCVKSLSFQEIIYVSAAATGTNSGASWANAFTKLQDALQEADCCPDRRLQIWVAKGTYYPDEGGDYVNNERGADFVMRNNVAIYGGFAGTETQLSQRNWQTNVTTLSGDIDQNDGPDFTNNGGNSYHVATSDETDSTAILDGFIITGGHADGNDDKPEGGGMRNTFSSSTIRNCTFLSNSAVYGGGMYNDNSSPQLTNCSFINNKVNGNGAGGMANENSSPVLTNCSFSGNIADFGGGMFNTSLSKPTLTNCNFQNNKATVTVGGGMYNLNASPILNNCIFTGNSANNGGGMYNNNASNSILTNCSFTGNFAGSDGGGMVNENSAPVVTNCSFSGNSATDLGGAIHNLVASPVIVNSILWNNTARAGGEILNTTSSPTVSYSIVKGGYAGTGNLDKDPLFVDAVNGNLHLQACSPAINTGNNTANNTATDLEGNPRKVGTIDMGAYEYQGVGSLTLLLTSPKTDSICNNTLFTYTATSSVEGTSFSWSRAAVAGISNAAANGASAAISETLHNTTSRPIDVVYVFTLARGACESKDSVRVTVNPTPAIIPVSDMTFCNGALVQPITFQSLAGNTAITWVSDASVGFGTSGSGNIPAFIASNPGVNTLIANVTVSTSIENCTGPSQSFRITVLPAPLLTSVKTTSVCNDAVFSYTATSSAPGTTFQWSRAAVAGISNGPASGTSATISETLHNTTPQPIEVIYLFALSTGGSCVSRDSVKVTVNPTPVIDPIRDTAFCDGSFAIEGIPFSTASPGAIFTWTNSNPAIGLPVSGSGSIPAFLARNNTGKPDTALITVSVKIGADDCAGQSRTFTITVNSAPTLTGTKDTSVCNDALFTYTASSSVAGTTFSWSRAAVAGISNGPDSGSSAVISEALHNTTSQPVNVYYVFTLTTGSGCMTIDSLKVRVNPSPTLNPIDDRVVCNGQFVPEISFTSPSPGAIFSWTNSNPAIGLPVSGSGSIPAFLARNNTGKPDTALITVSVKIGADDCAGQSRTFRIIVRPAALLTSIKTTSVCNDAVFSYTATSSAPGTTFQWSRAAVAGISNAASSGTSATISETLHNTTPQPIEVIYLFTLSAGDVSCKSIDTLRVTVNPIPVLVPVSDRVVCNGDFISAGISFSSTSPNATFVWTNDNPGIGLPVSGIGSIPGFTPINNTNGVAIAHITVYPVIGNECKGASQTFSITVNPGPGLTSTKDISICNKTQFNYTATSSADATEFSWTRLPLPDDSISATGPANGTSATISDLLSNSGTQPKVVEYSFTLSKGGGCKSTASVLVTVNPTPAIAPIQDVTVCNGVTVSPIIFSSATKNAIFRWTNSDTAIGLPSAGSDSIPAFSARNNTTNPITALITVFVRAGTATCAEESRTFNITVLPAPLLTSAKTASVCNNTLFTYTATSSAPGTNVTWRRAAVSGISSGSAVGTSAEISEVLHNETTQPIDVVYALTLSTGGACDSKDSVRVTVNPIPALDSIPDMTFCNGQLAGGVVFNTSTNSAVVRWTSDKAIGFETTGTGNLPAFIAQNLDTVPVLATISVSTAIGEGCAGQSRIFRITVNPGPTLTSTKDTSICNNTHFRYTATSSADSTVFQWTRLAVDSVETSGPGSGTSAAISDTLRNSGTQPKVVQYIVTLSTEKGCTSTYTVNVTVNPTPAVQRVDSMTFCNLALVQPITFHPLTGNTVITWESDTTIGFGRSGTNSIPAFIASNPGNEILTATITVLPSAGDNCPGDSISFMMAVHPTPVLTSPRINSICDNTTFDYVAESSAIGITNFSWTRAAVASISPATGSGGSEEITEMLHNSSSHPDSVFYVFNLSTGCGSEYKDSITLIVNPTPVINPVSDTTFCNGTLVNGGIPFTTASPDARFTWTNSNPDIGLPVSGSGSIPGFVATNKKNVPDTALITVSITASADNCSGKDTTFRMIVLPSPLRPSFTSLSGIRDSLPLLLCSQSENINFNITSPAAGVRYNWTSVNTNSSQLSIRNPLHANTVISFFQQGDYTIQVTARDSVTSCIDLVSQQVVVSGNVSGISKERIFVMQPGNLLVYPDNSLDGYQWGYDSISRTPTDTSFSAPMIFPGQTHQFFIPDSRGVDTTKYLYWVQLQNNGCTTRVYYNGPYRAQRVVQPDPVSSEVQLQILPNPNNGLFEIALKGNIYGQMNARVYNAVGAVVFRKNFVKTIPVVNETFSTGHLPAGVYVLEITGSDLKKVVSRFVVQH